MTTPRRGFKMGRPATVLDEALIKKIADLVCEGNTPERAAVAVGVSRSTYYDWRARGKTEPGSVYEQLGEAVEQALAICETQAAQIVVRAAPTTWQAAAWLLERRFPDRWGRREKVDIEIYVRQRARELGLDEDEALEAVRPQLALVAG